MKNNKRVYQIGNLLLEYEGPDFEEKEYWSQFRYYGEGRPDVVYRVTSVDSLELPSVPCVHRGEYVDVYADEHTYIRVHYDDKKNQPLIIDTCATKQEEMQVHQVECLANVAENMNSRLVLLLMDLPGQMLQYKAVFLHASYVLYNGEAILFTAPKQVGKSTQAALWEQHRGATVVNGDRVILREVDGRWMAYGSPFSGTSRICQNMTAPLKCIVTLSQYTENKIRKTTTIEAFAALLDGCTYETWDKSQVNVVSDLAKELILQVPIYRLDCLPDEGAVEILQEVLENGC